MDNNPNVHKNEVGESDEKSQLAKVHKLLVSV